MASKDPFERIKTSNKAAFDAFIIWCATPPMEREHKTMEDLANHLGVNEKTLSTWKTIPGFYDLVKKQFDRGAGRRQQEVKLALYQEALKCENPAMVKLYLNYVEAWDDKLTAKIEVSGSINLVEYLKARKEANKNDK